MKKRFIAGAICPKCGATDAIRLYLPEGDEEDHQVRDCVDCGYQESLTQHLIVRQELGTRVNAMQADKTSAVTGAKTKPQRLKLIP